MAPIKWRQWAMNVVLGHTKTVSRCYCCLFKYCDNNYSIHSSYHTLIIVIRLLYGTIWHRFDDKLLKGELLWKALNRINMQQHNHVSLYWVKSKSEPSIEYFTDTTSEALDTEESHQLQKMSEDWKSTHIVWWWTTFQ